MAEIKKVNTGSVDMNLQESNSIGLNPQNPLPDKIDNFRKTQALFKDLLQNIWTGLRVVVFRRVNIGDFRISAEHLLILVVLDLVISFMLSFVKVGSSGFFNYYELPQAIFYIPLMLTVAYIISKVEEKQALSLAIPVALLAMSFPLEIIGNLIEIITTNKWIQTYSRFLYKMHYYLFVWWLIAAYSGILRISRPVRHKKLIGLVLIILLGIPLWYIPKGELWTKSYYDNQENKDYYAVVNEEAFYAQPALLNRDMMALQPGRKRAEDLYFVGFAGQSDEDVFMHEVTVIKKLFDERFGTAGRSIALINNPKTVKQSPIASRTSLAKMLKHIGKIMNPEEDVLFLYLTSHGYKDHELSISFWPLELNGIDPSWLKQILAESGIRWKVIAISACYSGGFVEPLKDDQTLILTASDANHSSFGCGKQSDFTYFGKAFFDEELRHTHSFITAFEKAKQSITKRELAEGNTPSNPQIYIGTAIRQKLNRLEALLRQP